MSGISATTSTANDGGPVSDHTWKSRDKWQRRSTVKSRSGFLQHYRLNRFPNWTERSERDTAYPCDDDEVVLADSEFACCRLNLSLGPTVADSQGPCFQANSLGVSG